MDRTVDTMDKKAAPRRRCVIIGGALIEDYAAIRRYLREDDFYVFCDSGLRHLEGLGAAPDLIIGDFDSYENPHSEVETIVLPHEKDDTDTGYAVKEAIKRGFKECLIIGAVGERLDHTLGNVYTLFMLDKHGVRGMIADDYSDMELVGREPVRIDDSYEYFSLLNISGEAKGITVEDALYPLTDAEIVTEFQLGVSNEPLPGKTAVVSVREGKLLLIRIRRAEREP